MAKIKGRNIHCGDGTTVDHFARNITLKYNVSRIGHNPRAKLKLPAASCLNEKTVRIIVAVARTSAPIYLNQFFLKRVQYRAILNYCRIVRL